MTGTIRQWLLGVVTRVHKLTRYPKHYIFKFYMIHIFFLADLLGANLPALKLLLWLENTVLRRRVVFS
jgi:hypothetical protein